jgi:plastocyanin
MARRLLAMLAISGTFSYAFAEPGRYDFQCTLHGGMRGEVVVTEG